MGYIREQKGELGTEWLLNDLRSSLTPAYLGRAHEQKVIKRNLSHRRLVELKRDGKTI